jgi:hypothetical protein
VLVIRSLAVLLTAPIWFLVLLALLSAIMFLGGHFIAPLTGTPAAVFVYAAQAIRHNYRGVLTGIMGCGLLASAALALATAIFGR